MFNSAIEAIRSQKSDGAFSRHFKVRIFYDPSGDEAFADFEGTADDSLKVVKCLKTIGYHNLHDHDLCVNMGTGKRYAVTIQEDTHTYLLCRF